MIIGLATAKFINKKVYLNLEECFSFIEKARKQNVDLLLFGEAFLQGFDSFTWNPKEDLLMGIERNSDVLVRIRNYCKEKNIAIGIGYIEREYIKLYCSYLIIDKKGNDLVNYRRISRGWRIKNSDNEVYKEGNGFYVFDFFGYKMTVALCGDFWEDEIIEKMPKNVETVLWPVYVQWNKEQWENIQLNEYIERSKLYCKNIFYVNSNCNDQKYLAFGGAFAVINNKLVASMDMEKEGILVINY